MILFNEKFLIEMVEIIFQLAFDIEQSENRRRLELAELAKVGLETTHSHCIHDNDLLNFSFWFITHVSLSSNNIFFHLTRIQVHVYTDS